MSLTTRELAETISENNGRSIEENSEAIEAAARTYGLVLEPLPVGPNGEGIWSDYDDERRPPDSSGGERMTVSCGGVNCRTRLGG